MRRSGYAVDLLVDPGGDRVVGVVVGGGILGSERVLPYEHVQVLGEDTIVARRHDATVDAPAWHQHGADARRSSSFRGKRVVTKDGRQLGSVDDLYVDGQTGAIDGLDIAGRKLGGLLWRHRLLSSSGGITIGPDVIVVPSEAAEQMEAPAKHRRGRERQGGER